jgi:hypothetical protein
MELVYCESRVAVAVGRGQFGSPGMLTSAVESGYHRAGEGTSTCVVKCRKTV